MADGLNQARAMRLAEIMHDFRSLQYYLASIQVDDTPTEDYYLDGYVILRTCIAEGQSVLASTYSHTSLSPNGDVEHEKSQLLLIIVDAGVRRFRCQRAYLRAVAAQRWANARKQMLRGQQAHPGNTAQLQQVDLALAQEISSITDEYVEHSLQVRDIAAGKYISDDPPLDRIRQALMLQGQ